MYDVILLVEQELTEPDAQRVVELHEQLPEQVKYHLIIPCEDAAAKVETSLATLAGTELYGMAATRYPAATADRQPDLAKVQQEAQRAVEQQARASLNRSLERLRALDRSADGSITYGKPVDAVIEEVKRSDGKEVVVLTRPHVIAEFFHVDWSAQARRHLGVPVLHLLEQYQEGPLESGR
jgi:hypothetical protein